MSKKSLDRAISIANSLFNRLERAGIRILISGANDRLYRDRVDELEVPQKKRFERYPSLWSPDRPTVAYVENCAFGIAIVEMSEDVHVRFFEGKLVRSAEFVPQIRSRFPIDQGWTTTKSLPSGRFRVVVYSPYRSVNWSQSWQEKGKSKIEGRFNEIFSLIKSSAQDLIVKVEEARRLAEIEHQRYLEQERLRRAAEKQRQLEEARKDSETQLRQIIARWGDVRNIESFLKGVEQTVLTLPQEKSEVLLARIKFAKDMLGTTEPLDYFLKWQSPDEIFASKYRSYFSDDD